MSARAVHGSDIAPPALHNSGYGPPPVVYHCPGIGATYRVEVAGLRRTCTHLWTLQGQTPAQVVAEAAMRILCALQSAESRGEDTTAHSARSGDEAVALQRVAQLATVLRSLGALEPFRGLVRVGVPAPQGSVNEPTAADALWPWLISHPEPDLLRIAWSVCAVSYLAPPLLLWTREPSLTWWRGDQVITLRWLDVPALSRSVP